MHSSGDFLSTPNLDYETWRDVVRSICGRYTPDGIEPKTFSGRARVRSICGFRAVELSSNADRLERTHQDVRADARDHYYAVFQMTGQCRIIQNERIVELTVGDVALVDAARPVTYVSEEGSAQWWGSLQLQRRSLLSHLGLEPRCPSRRSGAAAARPLRQLLQDGVERYKLPRDATGIDGIYEAHDGSHVAYQVKYRQKQHLAFAEVAPFLGITEQFSDRVIFTNGQGCPTRPMYEHVGSAPMCSVICRTMH
jgi:hypothetical protein